ncbi:MAG: glycosyltransferase [Abditibacteriota bacterium]|nr:glycosyltransferase [Abditibacteriota bacterium]
MDKIAIIIPCYNEAPTIKSTVEDCRKTIPEAVIYVYDNNSNDGTGEIAAAAGAIVRKETRQGKGNVIRSMLRDIDAECYIMVDGDNACTPGHIPEMVDLILNDKADLVIGDRLSSTYFEINKRLFHGFGNNLVRFMTNTLFKSDVKDILTGYRAMSYDFAKTYPVLSKGFEIETEMTIHAIEKNMRVSNVVLNFVDRPAGNKSKLNTYTDGMKVMLTVLGLFKTYRPMAFFSIIGTVLALLSIGFFIPVLCGYVKTGLVDKFPTLIVCSFTGLAAILSFFTGFILDTIVHKDKCDFEFRLKKTHERFEELKKK